MGNSQVAVLAQLVRDQQELEMHREAEARAIAHGLIQTYVGRNRKGIDIQNFYSALVKALLSTRAQAQADCSGEEVLTLT